jgi:hypothetical protein
VQKAIKSGRVTCVRRGADGKLCAIDQVLADQQWAARTDPVEAARSGTVITPPSSGELPLDVSPAASPENAPASKAPGEADGFYAARATKTFYEAEQAKLDFLKNAGELIPKDEQTRVSARRYRAMRDKLQGIPDRTCDVLAAERDAGAIHALLTKEINQVLHELSNDAIAELARGNSERMAA